MHEQIESVWFSVTYPVTVVVLKCNIQLFFVVDCFNTT